MKRQTLSYKKAHEEFITEGVNDFRISHLENLPIFWHIMKAYEIILLDFRLKL